MTLIYQRDNLEGRPKTHAFVLGIGRFSELQNLGANRLACPDSARAIIDFLVRHADSLVSPLASIECLLSDPRTPLGQFDQFPKCHDTFDPRTSDEIAAGTLRNVQDACQDWRSRISPGDSVFFYGCSHGLAGLSEEALLVLEDAASLAEENWHELLDVASIAKFTAPELQAGSVWVFFDACQEVYPSIKDAIGGTRAYVPMSANFLQMTQNNVDAVALAAARYGHEAHAPRGGGVAYFTQALIIGLSKCLVEEISDEWHVTGKEILFGIHEVSLAVSGEQLNTAPFHPFNQNRSLLIVESPQVPVSIKTDPVELMSSATEVSISHLGEARGGLCASLEMIDEVWRCSLMPSTDEFEVVLKVNGSNLRSIFLPKPPAVRLELADG